MARITRASVAKQTVPPTPNVQAPAQSAPTTKAKINTNPSALTKRGRSKKNTTSSATALPTLSPDGAASSPREVSVDVKAEETKEAANIGKKRKRPIDDDAEEEYEELPHNMGRVLKAKKGRVKTEEQASAEPSPTKRSAKKASVKLEEPSEEKTSISAEEGAVASIHAQRNDKAVGAETRTPVKSTPKEKSAVPPDVAPTSAKKPKTNTPKKNEYGLTPGVSPFPDYPHPTPAECYEVHRLLKEHHPDCQGRPNTIPPPSQIIAGCGQVPSILDALIRTLLSAATTGKNSSSAYQGMVARYGNTEKGVGKGSVDYNAVRLAPQADLEAAIASGGLAKNKSKNIKAILDMVYEENQERRKAHLAPKTDPDSAAPKGADEETEEQKAAEIALAEDDVLSLDHYYTLPTYDAIFTFVKYPGIGVKTAACTALFCMQRDCFAVDTHVFRLAQWLGWMPPDNKKVGRDTTFSHLEVRIPDELKYDLHQLFLKHGKTCPRCRAATGEGSANWEEGCVIDHLVTRTGARKGGAGSPTKKGTPKSAAAAKKGKKKAKDSEDEDDNDSRMPALNDDEDEADDEEPSMPDLDDEEEYTTPLKTTKKTPRSASVKKTLQKASGDLPVTTPSKEAPRKKGTPATSSTKKRSTRAAK